MQRRSYYWDSCWLVIPPGMSEGIKSLNTLSVPFGDHSVDVIFHELRAQLLIPCMDEIQLLVTKLFDVHHLVSCLVDRVNEFIQFEVDRTRVSILGVLNDEHHEERDDRRSSIYDKLPGIRVVEERSRDRPNSDDENGAYERPFGPEPA